VEESVQVGVKRSTVAGRKDAPVRVSDNLTV